MGATHNLTTANGTVTITPSNGNKIAIQRDYDSTGNNYKPDFPKNYVGTHPHRHWLSTNNNIKAEITAGLDNIIVGEDRRLIWIEERWEIQEDVLNLKTGVQILKKTAYSYRVGNQAWKPKDQIITWSITGGNNGSLIPGVDNYETAVNTPGIAKKVRKMELWAVHNTWGAGGAGAGSQSYRKAICYKNPGHKGYIGYNKGYDNPFQPSCKFTIDHDHVMCKARLKMLIEPGDELVKKVTFRPKWTNSSDFAPLRSATTMASNGSLASGNLNIEQTGATIGTDIDNLAIRSVARGKKVKLEMKITDHGDEEGNFILDHGPCKAKVDPTVTVVPLTLTGQGLQISEETDVDFEATLDNTIYFGTRMTMTQFDTADPSGASEYRIQISIPGLSTQQVGKRWEQLQDYYENDSYTYEQTNNIITSSESTWTNLSNTNSSNVSNLPAFKLLSHTVDLGSYLTHEQVADKVVTVKVLENTGTPEAPVWAAINKPGSIVKIKMVRGAQEPTFWLPNFEYGSGDACFDTPQSDGKPVPVSLRTAIEENSEWNPPSPVEYYTGGSGCVVTPITSADVSEGNFYWEFTTRSNQGTGTGNASDKHIYMNELLDYHDSFIYVQGDSETNEAFEARKPNGKKRSLGGRPHIMRTSKTLDDNNTQLRWTLSHAKGANTPIEITGFIVANGYKTQCEVLDYYCKAPDSSSDPNYVVIRPDNTDNDDRYSMQNQEIIMARDEHHLRIISQVGSIPELSINSITNDTEYSDNETPLDLRMNMNVEVNKTDFRSVRARMDNYIDDPVQTGDEAKQMDFTYTFNPTTGYWSGVRTGTSESVLAESEEVTNLSSIPMPSPSDGDNKVYPTMGSYSARLAGYDANGNWLTAADISSNHVAPPVTTTTTSTATTTYTSTTTTSGSFTFTDSAVSQTGDLIDYYWSVVNAPTNLTGFEIEVSTDNSNWVEAKTDAEGGLGSAARQFRFEVSDLTNSTWYPDGAPDPVPSTGNSIYFRAVMITDTGEHRTSGIHHTIASATTTTTTQTSMTSMTSMTSNTTTTTAPVVYGTNIDWAYEEAGPKRAEISVSWSPFTPPSGSLEGYVIKIYESDSSDTTGTLITTENISATENNSATVSILANSISGFDSKLSVGKYIKVGVSATYDMGKTTAETLNSAAGGTQIAVSTAQTTTTAHSITTTTTTTTQAPVTTQSHATTEAPTSASVPFGDDAQVWLSHTSNTGNMTLNFNMYAAGSPQYHDLEFRLKNGSDFTTPSVNVIEVHDINGTSKSYTFQSNSGDTIQVRTRGKSHTGEGGTNGAWSEWGDFEWTLGTEKTL